MTESVWSPILILLLTAFLAGTEAHDESGSFTHNSAVASASASASSAFSGAGRFAATATDNDAGVKGIHSYDNVEFSNGKQPNDMKNSKSGSGCAKCNWEDDDYWEMDEPETEAEDESENDCDDGQYREEQNDRPAAVLSRGVEKIGVGSRVAADSSSNKTPGLPVTGSYQQPISQWSGAASASPSRGENYGGSTLRTTHQPSDRWSNTGFVNRDNSNVAVTNDAVESRKKGSETASRSYGSLPASEGHPRTGSAPSNNGYGPNSNPYQGVSDNDETASSIIGKYEGNVDGGHLFDSVGATRPTAAGETDSGRKTSFNDTPPGTSARPKSLDARRTVSNNPPKHGKGPSSLDKSSPVSDHSISKDKDSKIFYINVSPAPGKSVKNPARSRTYVPHAVTKSSRQPSTPEATGTTTSPYHLGTTTAARQSGYLGATEATKSSYQSPPYGDGQHTKPPLKNHQPPLRGAIAGQSGAEFSGPESNSYSTSQGTHYTPESSRDDCKGEGYNCGSESGCSGAPKTSGLAGSYRLCDRQYLPEGVTKTSIPAEKYGPLTDSLSQRPPATVSVESGTVTVSSGATPTAFAPTNPPYANKMENPVDIPDRYKMNPFLNKQISPGILNVPLLTPTSSKPIGQGNPFLSGFAGPGALSSINSASGYPPGGSLGTLKTVGKDNPFLQTVAPVRVRTGAIDSWVASESAGPRDNTRAKNIIRGSQSGEYNPIHPIGKGENSDGGSGKVLASNWGVSSPCSSISLCTGKIADTTNPLATNRGTGNGEGVANHSSGFGQAFPRLRGSGNEAPFAGSFGSAYASSYANSNSDSYSAKDPATVFRQADNGGWASSGAESKSGSGSWSSNGASAYASSSAFNWAGVAPLHG